MHVAIDGRPAGIIALADVVRPEAKSAIAALRTRGLEVVMADSSFDGAPAAVSSWSWVPALGQDDRGHRGDLNVDLVEKFVGERFVEGLERLVYGDCAIEIAGAVQRDAEVEHRLRVVGA